MCKAVEYSINLYEKRENMSPQKFYIIIPAYEPDEKMLRIIDDISSQTDYKIVVVNDGSAKDKDELFEKASEKATILKHEVNRGKGAGIKTALKYIADSNDDNIGIIIVDADGQHKIHDIKRIAAALTENPDKLIMGCRKFTGKIPARSKFGNNVTKLVFALAAGVKVSDTQTGLRGFTDTFIPFMLGIKGERYEFEMNMLLECAREHIEFFEVPIETVYIGKNETSHFNPIKDSFRIYKDILKFSCSSFLSFLVDYTFYSGFIILTNSVTKSNIGARIISSCFNFTLNKKFVFKNKGSVVKTAGKYFLVAAGILTLNTVLLKLCTSYLIKNKFIAKIIIEIILFFFNWVIQRSFVFAKEEKGIESAK